MLLTQIKALHLGMYLMPIILVHWVCILNQLDHCIMVCISYQSDHNIEVCLDLLGYQSIIPHANLVMKLGTMICCNGITQHWHTSTMKLIKNCGLMYPVWWFVSFVRTLLLWPVRGRKVMRESFYHLEAKLCFVYSSFTYKPHTVS